MRDRKVISLGAWCQVREQLNRAHVDVINSPFDWLVTPFDSIIPVFSDEGAGFVNCIAPYQDGKSVRCVEYGVLYHHEFERGDDGIVRINTKALEKSRQKLLYKWRRMDEACEGAEPLLFIRMGGEATPAVAWPYMREAAPFALSKLNKLSSFISTRYPKLDFKLAFLYFGETTDIESDHEVDDRVIIYRLPWPRPVVGARWEGDGEHWATALNALGARMLSDAT